MNIFRKYIAVLLVLSMVLTMTGVAFAASAKFSKGDYVEFKGNLYGYKKHNSGSKSKVIIRKGSVAKVVDIYKTKWVKLKLGEASNAPQLWFGTEKLKKTKSEFSIVIYSSGGGNHSVVAVKPIFIES